MGGTRRIAGVLALAGGLAAAVVVPTGAAAQHPRLCLLNCSTTTAAAPTTVPPSFGQATVTNVTYTSATVSAPVTPGSVGADAGFYVYQGNSQVQETGFQQLQASASPSSVRSALGDLVPNETYQVEVEGEPIGDPGATLTRGGAARFTTPLEPALSVHVKSGTQAITLGQSATLDASVSGVAAATSPVVLQVATAPYRRYTQLLSLYGSGPVSGQVLNGGFSFSQPVNRNVRLRAYIPGLEGGGTHHIRRPSASKFVTVYVFPSGGGSLSRPDDNATIVAEANYTVHPLPRGWVGEFVYFYSSATPRGPYRLLGRVRLRPASAAVYGQQGIGARLSFSAPGNVYGLQCIRHRILSDMGLPFTNTKCGAPTISP